MRSSNPMLNNNVFDAEVMGAGEVMTINGTVNKALILLGLTVLTASMVWSKFFAVIQNIQNGELAAVNQASAVAMGSLVVGGIAGFILALVTTFKRSWAGVTAPLYALCEGCVLGGLSALFEMHYPGIIMQAVALTFGTMFCLLLAYKSGFIQPTENFKLGVVAATGAIMLIYAASMILSWFHIQIPGIFGNGPIGIAFSLFIVGIAALNLVLDFDFIETGARSGAPKYMEWYGAFGLLVTLVWLYMEILRLLSKLRERR
jgi:uncharacterized YccA/Bax inhibitor family protein